MANRKLAESKFPSSSSLQGVPLLSMTGHGTGRVERAGAGTVATEIRSVNNRHLKISLRLCDGLGGLESAIESLVRSRIHRGSIQLNLFWTGRAVVENFQIQADIAEGYVKQFRQFAERMGLDPAVRFSDLVNLPGVVSEVGGTSEPSQEIEDFVLQSVELALNDLQQMRKREGLAMQRELLEQLSALQNTLSLIEGRVPNLMSEYRQRLKTRVVAAISEALGQSLDVDPSPGQSFASTGLAATVVENTDLLREVALMADRSDVREEVVRLRSHFSQFGELLASSESQGRRLDFLVQEMFREANTIGSKASDASISQSVVDIKATLEQVREMIQNVE